MTSQLSSPSLPDGAPHGLAGPADLSLMLLDNMSNPVYAIDRDYRLILVNAAFCTNMRMRQSELLGRKLPEVVPLHERPRIMSAYDRVMAGGAAEWVLHESLLRAGRWVDLHLFAIPAGVGVIVRDVTSQIEAEQARATSQEHLQRALDGGSMGDWSWDAATDMVTLSDRAAALYDIRPEAISLARTHLRRTLVHPDDIGCVEATAQRALEEQTQYDVEYRVKRRDGWRWVRAMGGPHIVDGVLVGMHGLTQDIHELKLAEERLRAEIAERERIQQRQAFLIHELNHRVKNILAMVQAMAGQTLTNTGVGKSAREALDQRLLALARTHDVLTREHWEGAEMSDIVAGSVGLPEEQDGDRFHIDGPRLRLEPKTAVSLAMILHELATNAAKYGALSSPQGSVEVRWTTSSQTDGVRLDMMWAERGGPPARKPRRTGFGVRLIQRSLAAEHGKAEISYPKEGLLCRLTAVLPPLQN